jgi:integrase
MKFTQARIDGLTCPSGRRDKLFFDDEVRALAVRVTSTGSKSFLCQFTADGVRRRIPLGSCDSILLPDARKAALSFMGQVAQGRDPADERRSRRHIAKNTPTLGELVDKWATLHVSGLSLNYQKGGPLSIRHVFKDSLALPITKIDAALVMQAVDKFVLAGKPSMGRAAALNGASCFAWARRRNLVHGENPFARLDLPAEVRRERVLADDELCALWAATEKPTSVNAVVRLLMLTAQRLREVAGMRRSELDADLTTWALPGGRNKSQREHLVPISMPAREIILQSGQRPELTSEGLLFPGPHGKMLTGWGQHKLVLDRDSGIREWRFHDLRRTAVTRMQKLSIKLEVSESVLNHKGSRKGVAGIYHKYEFADEKRFALDSWAAELMRIVKGWDDAQNVLSLASAIGLRGRSVAR